MNPRVKPTLVILAFLFAIVIPIQADITVVTFEDRNNNGSRDQGEPLLTGLMASGTDMLGNTLPLLDDGQGTFILPGLVFTGRVRIEMTGYTYDLRQGKNHPTTIFFAEDGDLIEVPVLVDQPLDLNSANILVPCYEKGSAELKGASPAFVRFPFSASGVAEKFGGDAPNPTEDAQIDQIGSTWGVTYQRNYHRAFSAALVKRHVGLGPQGLSAVYTLTYDDQGVAMVDHFELEGITPAVGPTLRFGSLRREIVNSPIDESMPYALSTVLDLTRRASYDIDAFDKVGKAAYGDIEMGEDGRTLWMVNTYQRSIVSMDVGKQELDPQGEDLENYPIDELPGIPNLNFRYRMCVNAGGSSNVNGAEAFTDVNKVAWDKNRYSIGGQSGYLNFSVGNTLNGSAKTSAAAIYQTYKKGDFEYDIPVPEDETFEVLLHFAEPENLVEGDRLFDIMSGDKVLVSNFDIVQHAKGNKKATVLKLQVPSENKMLNLKFVSKFATKKKEALLSGYEVLGQSVSQSGVLRPWGLAFHQGRGYLGVVSDASKSMSREHLFAYLLSFDPENVSAGFREELAFPLGYPRERLSNANQSNPQPLRSGAWQPWVESWEQTMIPTIGEPLSIDNGLLCGYSQPMFAQINFTSDGSIILGLMDRWAHQTGHLNYSTKLGDRTLVIGYAGGDILKVFREDNGTYILEKNNSDPGFYYSKKDGPSYNGEFFYDDYYSTYLADHGELITGGMITLPGSNEVAATVHNPNLVDLPYFDYQGLFSQGLHFYDHNTGKKTRYYLFVDQYILGKANGLGDITVAVDAVPQAVGNYVWCDGNGNGIQDPTERGLSNLEVRLLDRENALTEVGRMSTDANGEYYFDNLLPAHEYELRIDLQDLKDRHFSGGVSPIVMSDTLINSDASDTIVPGFAIIRFMSGDQGLNRDDLDFGFLGPEALSDVKVKCEDPTIMGGGCADFVLADVAACASANANTTVTLHPSFNDADSMRNEITADIRVCDPDSTLYARVMLTSDPNCFSISQIRLVVDNAMVPQDIDYLEFVCPSGTFDAVDYITQKGFVNVMVMDAAGMTPDPTNIDLSTTVFPLNLTYTAEIMSTPPCDIEGMITLEAISPSIVDAGDSATVCGLDCVDLTSLGAIFNPNGSGATSATWTSTGSGDFIDDNSFAGARLYCPSQADVDAGQVNLVLTVDDDPCVAPSLSDFVVITFQSAAPQILPGESMDTVDCIHPFAIDPENNDTFPAACRLLVECDDTLMGIPTVYEVLIGDCEDIVKRIKRTIEFTHKGIDYFCMDTIAIRALPDTIVCPPMRDTVYCHDDYLKDENGHPSPLETGFPLADSIPLWPVPPGICDIQAEYKDTEFPGICPITIKREWFIANTCSGNTETCVQWLMIFDTVPPTIENLDTTFIIYTGSHDCYAEVYVPPIEVTDTCTGVKIVKARIENYGTLALSLNPKTGLWESHEKIKIPVSEIDLSSNYYLGIRTIIYEAFDMCHNQSIDSVDLIVVDKTKPVVICDDAVNVTVSDTIEWIHASTFDEGSEDNCGVALQLVRRKDWATACGVDLCDDILPFCVSAHQDSVWIARLESDKDINPVEAHYAQQLDWVTSDPGACNFFLFYGWLYDLLAVPTLSCIEHPYNVNEDYVKKILRTLECEVNEETIDSIFPNLINVNFFLQSVEDLLKLFLKYPTLNDPGQMIADIGSQIGGGWSDAVPVCCEDACTDIMVETLTMDYWCNWSKCWSILRVEDKTPPKVISELNDVSITCASYKTYYEAAVNLALEGDYDSLQSVLGFYDQIPAKGYEKIPQTSFDLYEISCDSNLVTKDSLVYDEHLGYQWKTYTYYRAEYDTLVSQRYNGRIADNCGLVSIETMPWVNIDHCGTGYVKRVFKFVGQCGTQGSTHKADTITKTQTIWITSDCEITPAMFEVPKDTIIYACGIDYESDGSGKVGGAAGPANTGMGRYTFDNDCRLVGVGYYDKVFKIVGGDAACYKIVRTWCFADWCELGDSPLDKAWWFNPKYQGKYLSYTQKIIMLDSTPPVCIVDSIPSVIEAAGCDYTLNTFVRVEDECGVLHYSWKVIDTKTLLVAGSGQGELNSSAEDGFPVELTGLVSGNYSLKVIVTDECQNESICDVPFEVQTGKKPAAICLSSLTVELNPMDLDGDGVIDTAMAEVQALAFNSSSSAACGSSTSKLKFRIDVADSDPALPASSGTKLLLGCEDIGNHQVRMYVLDESGTWDYCEVLLIVQDNMGGCGGAQVTPGAITTSTLPGTGTPTKSKAKTGDKTSVVIAGDANSNSTAEIVDAYTFELLQNRPNPWHGETVIGFSISENSEITLTVFDVTGRSIITENSIFDKGYHEWTIDRSQVINNGVFFYQLSDGTNMLMKKMIVID